MPEGSVDLTMVLTIDALGKRYSLLPSEVMQKANTWDIFVMDAAISYENHKNEEAMAKYDNKPRDTENKPVTNEDLLTAFTKFKTENHG
jgi:hypothetical protein